jgi:hypothetical protein
MLRMVNPALNPNGYIAAAGALLAAGIMVDLASRGSSATRRERLRFMTPSLWMQK